MNRNGADHPEVLEAANGSRGSTHRKLLIGGAALVGILVLAVLILRAFTTTTADQALCEKIDRFIVTSEKAILASQDLSADDKAARIRFYEAFRNDPPVCRTAPAPKVP